MDIRGGEQAVGNQEEVGSNFLEGWCQALETGAKLVDLARLLPERELSADFMLVRIAGKEQSDIKNRLIPDDFQQIL